MNGAPEMIVRPPDLGYGPLPSTELQSMRFEYSRSNPAGLGFGADGLGTSIRTALRSVCREV